MPVAIAGRAVRGRLAAATLAVLTVLGAATVVAFSPTAAGAAAPPAGIAAAAPATVTTEDGRSIVVDAGTDIAATDATVKVTGSGYVGPFEDLFVAICLADGNAPVSLTNCIGGPIPGSGSLAWGLLLPRPGRLRRRSPNGAMAASLSP